MNNLDIVNKLSLSELLVLKMKMFTTPKKFTGTSPNTTTQHAIHIKESPQNFDLRISNSFTYVIFCKILLYYSVTVCFFDTLFGWRCVETLSEIKSLQTIHSTIKVFRNTSQTSPVMFLVHRLFKVCTLNTHAHTNITISLYMDCS